MIKLILSDCTTHSTKPLTNKIISFKIADFDFGTIYLYKYKRIIIS